MDIFFISVSNLHDKFKVEYIEGYRVYQIPYSLALNKLLLFYPLARKIIDILNAELPNAIYQRILNSFSFHLAKFCKNKQVNHLIHVADKYSLVFEGITVSRFVRQWMFRSIKNSRSNFITQTSEQTNLLNYLGVTTALQIYNFHPIIEFDLESSRLKKLNEFTKKIVWIGNSRPVKRLNLFIDLAKSFSRNKNLEFVIIGRVDQYIDSLNGIKNVKYLGERDNNFVNQFLEESAYLTVNTSSSEGFSNVFIQSWLKGVPVISLNSNPDSLFDKFELGEYCKDNLEVLYNSIETFLSNSKNYVDVSNSCFQQSNELFTIDKSIDKIKELL